MTIDIQTSGLYIGIIGVAAAIVMPIIVYYLQNNKKHLAYNELQNISLVSVNDNVKDKVEVKYAGKVVNNLYLLTVLFKNTGRVPIKNSDIVSPIKLEYKQKFMECRVIDKSTAGLDIKLVSPDENSVLINFNLLNPGEYFVLKFVSLSRLSDPKIVLRISGLSRINIGSTSNEYRAIATYFAMIVLIFVLIPTIVIAFNFPNYIHSTLLTTISLISVSISIIVGLLVLFYQIRSE